jgi:F-type H+-transporting ATPase subunit delta
MKQRTLIQEYSRAIYGLATDQVEPIITFFETTIHLVRTSKELDTALNHPLLSTEQKVSVLLAAISEPVPAVGKEAIRNLVANRRLALLPEIVEYLRAMYYNSTSVVEVVITSVFPIPEEQQQTLTERLSRFTGKKVLPRFQLNRELIGGFVLKIGDLIIDNSVKTELHNLKMRLLAPSLG